MRGPACPFVLLLHRTSPQTWSHALTSKDGVCTSSLQFSLTQLCPWQVLGSEFLTDNITSLSHSLRISYSAFDYTLPFPNSSSIHPHLLNPSSLHVLASPSLLLHPPPHPHPTHLPSFTTPTPQPSESSLCFLITTGCEAGPGVWSVYQVFQH